MLAIGLGHPRFLYNDLNLLTQVITLLIIFLSLYYKKKGKVKLHGATIGIAVILHTLTFVLVMGPIFSQNFGFFSTETSLSLVQITWLHAVPGAIALILAIFLVAIWAVQSSKVDGCYARKRIMDVTIVLWVFSLVFGIATYILIYL